MTNLNLLSLTQRKTLLNAVANATTEATQAQATTGSTPDIGLSVAQTPKTILYLPKDDSIQKQSFITHIVYRPNDSSSDLISIGGKTCGIEGSGIISDTYINDVQDNTLGSIKTMSATSSATTYKGMSPANLHKIKQVIYNLHHQNNVPPSGGNGGNTPEVPGGGNEGGGDTPEVPGGGNEGGGDTPDVPGGGNEGGGDTPDVPGGGNEGGGDTPDVPGGGDEGGDDTPPDDPNYKSFITTCNGTGATFDTVNEMFTVLEEHGIDTSKGISRADLVKLSQDDTWEDSHWDFFGCMNRIFDVLDGDAKSLSANIYNDGDDGYLSKEELMVFFPDGKIDEQASDYLNRVLTYSAKLNEYYQTLSDREKIEFVMDKVVEYCEARGMQAQIDALVRLRNNQQDYRVTNGTATSSDLIFGNIVFADLGGYVERIGEDGKKYYTITGGQYSMVSYGSTQTTYTSQGHTYNVQLFGDDTKYDGVKYGDLGITLNSNDEYCLLAQPWYMLADTLIHELTHATAYQYVSGTNSGNFDSFNSDKIYEFYEKGLITLSEWQEFQNNQSTKTEPLYSKLVYLVECQCGEYAAYQVGADFMDSVGGDMLEDYQESYIGYSPFQKTYITQYVNVSNGVNGADEKNSIPEHLLTTGYISEKTPENNPPIPDYKWWTDGDNGILA